MLQQICQTTRLGQIVALPVEVIRLHPQQQHLSVTGNKREATGRLFDALQHRSIDNCDSKCEESEREADNIGRGRSRRTADSSDQHRAESNSRTDSETDPLLFDRVRYTLQVLSESHENDELDGHNKNECWS
jgi:hypothetical protein